MKTPFDIAKTAALELLEVGLQRFDEAPADPWYSGIFHTLELVRRDVCNQLEIDYASFDDFGGSWDRIAKPIQLMARVVKGREDGHALLISHLAAHTEAAESFMEDACLMGVYMEEKVPQALRIEPEVRASLRRNTPQAAEA